MLKTKSSLHKILDYVKTCNEDFNILIENRDEIEKEISKRKKGSKTNERYNN